MHKTRVLAGLAVLVCVLTATALADSQARIVRLSYLSGEVELDRRDGRGYEDGFLNMPITESMRLWTHGDGFAEVELEDGSTLRLTPDTRVEFVELRRRSTGETVTMVEFQEGTAYFDLRGGDDEFRLVFGRNQEIRIERSANFRITIDRSSLELAVTKGRLELLAAGGSVEVRKGETLTFNVDNPSRYVLVDEVREARYDDWDRDREDERERYLARRERDIRYPYAYGVADLHYYGTYVYVPGYGYVWRPSYVSTGWSPFQDGAWVWYPGYGYVWVSSYPWGWVPYRYGTWVYLTSHGWCWQPSSGSWQWAAVPRVHDRWPRGFDRPSGHNRGPVPIGRPYRDVWDEERDRARRDSARDGEESIFTRARREADRRRAGNNAAPAAPPTSVPPPSTEPAAPPAAPTAETRRSGPSPAREPGGESGGTLFERARREGEGRRTGPPSPAPEARPAPAPSAPPPSRPAPSAAPAPSTPPPAAPARSGWSSGSGSSGSSDSGSRGSSRESSPTRERAVPQ
jgi:hypothetical protein